MNDDEFGRDLASRLHQGDPGTPDGLLSGSLQRARPECLGDAELVTRVGIECVVRHQLVGHLFGQRRIESPADVDPRQFPVFGFDIRLQFVVLAFKFSMLAVGLRMHRDVLAGGHRHRPGHQPGNAGDQNALPAAVRSRHAKYQAGRGNNAVVRTEHGGAQPAHPACAMSFVMASRHEGSLCKGQEPARE